ncbi:MAG: DUF58 domain-containing protein [Chloroflexi bacterium]|nr:DUF58 domain-containing protein [Chloroflexota bacterium]
MKRLLLLGCLIYGLLLWGLTTLNGKLIALAIPLVIYLGASLFYGPERPRLKITRTLSASRVSQDMPVVVKLSIVNVGARLEEVLIRDPLPAFEVGYAMRMLELVDGEPHILTSLVPGETFDLEYTVTGSRGVFYFQDVQVTASDFLGIFRRQVTLPAPGRLVVLPLVLKLRRVAIRPLRTRGTIGPLPARRGGSGIDFFGVREYQPGDSLRWINWRMSARHPRALFTTEFEQERIADVGLILDARQRHDLWVGGDAIFEHAVCATAALAEAFLSDGNRVGMLTYGGFLDWTFPGYGRIQQERILRSLARARMGESLVFDKLNHLPARFFPAKSQLVLISSLCREDVPMLIRLRARGYQLLVISPNPVAFEAVSLESHPSVDLAVRIARLERTLLLRKLRQASIQVVDWQIHKPFDQAIHASLSRMPHWFRAVGVGL